MAAAEAAETASLLNNYGFSLQYTGFIGFGVDFSLQYTIFWGFGVEILHVDHKNIIIIIILRNKYKKEKATLQKKLLGIFEKPFNNN